MSLHEARARGRVVVETDFVNEPKENWVLEGDGSMELTQGAMRIRALKQTATVWHTQHLSGDVLVEFVATVDPPEGAANINAFLHANDPSGEPIFAGKRSGKYGEYHTLPLYIFTFTGVVPGQANATGWSRVRRDPGFVMISENADYKARTNETYKISILLEGKRIRYYINEELVHDCTDPEPYRSGWFALRTWHTNLSVTQLTIRELGATGAS